MLKFAVFGDPIAHSLSPQIHAAFAKQFGISLTYDRIQVPSGHLAEALSDFKKSGGFGANITVPLKQEAFTLCQQLSESATLAEAVNTIGWNEQGLWGDNTDGQGLIHDLTINHHLDLTGAKILLLGAGGAARGILAPLLAFSPQLTVVNRDIQKAQAMLIPYPQVNAFSYENMLDEATAYDFVINATSASLNISVPPIPRYCVKNACCIDLAYRLNAHTPFLHWALENQASRIIDGLGMLVEQAALGFSLWHGKTPDTKAVIAAL